MRPDRPGLDSSGSSWWLILILPLLCCGLPVLVASGVLVGVVGLLHHLWPLIVVAVVILIAAFLRWHRLGRRSQCAVSPGRPKDTHYSEHGTLR